MRFFAKFTLIFNGCFLAYIVLRAIDLAGRKAGHFDSITLLPPVKNTIVVAGVTAVIVNLVFNLVLVFMLGLKFQHKLPKWIIWTNFLFLIAQLSFYFY